MCDVGCIKYFVVPCNGIIGRPMYWAVRKGAAVGMRVRFCGPKRGQSWLFGRKERNRPAAVKKRQKMMESHKYHKKTQTS